MRLEQLTIKNVRGIRRLDLSIACESLVVWGPNGTGKSAFVDALEFLLTGHMSRLEGEGTAGMTLANHGRNVLVGQEESFVQAQFRNTNTKATATIRRDLGTAGELTVVDGDRAIATALVERAASRAFLLTRRDMLRYIAAQPKTRAQQVQGVLPLEGVETLRANCRSALSAAIRAVAVAERDVRLAEGALAAKLGLEAFSPEAALAAVNALRVTLGGQNLRRLTDTRAGLPEPAAATQGTTTAAVLMRAVAEIEGRLGAPIVALAQQAIRDLATEVADMQEDRDGLAAALHFSLLEAGLAALDGTPECPLCNLPWDADDLRSHLAERHRLAEPLRARMEAMRELAQPAKDWTQAQVLGLVALAHPESADLGVETRASAEAIGTRLSALSEALDTPLTAPTGAIDEAALSLGEIQGLLDLAKSDLEGKVPTRTPQQEAWDVLTQAQSDLERRTQGKADQVIAMRIEVNAQRLRMAIVAAHDEVLSGLYVAIRNRFRDLYCEMTGQERAAFQPTLDQADAGLEFSVPFYDKGNHPPNALHSEGQQDSMAICLFLALSERLGEDALGVTVLDDVVLSVDRRYRRRLCALLATQFPSRQFVVTTHDPTWARQLQSTRVVSQKQSVRLFHWTLIDGPSLHREVDLWDTARAALAVCDVVSASGHLRRGMEEFFARACGRLWAHLRYRADEAWMLGDYFPSAMGRWLKWWGKAARVARDAGRTELADRLDAQLVTGQGIYRRTTADLWSLNKGIHFDNWHNLEKEDFEPIFLAFEDACRLFVCKRKTCRGMVRIAATGMTPQRLSCPCGSIDLRLTAEVDPEPLAPLV